MPPADEHAPVLVWRLGEALLCAQVDAILEVAAVRGSGVVATQEGEAPLVRLPGLPAGEPRRAVVVRTGDGLLALPADAIEGIRAIAPDRFAPPPHWLDAVAGEHVRALVTLDDDRLAVLLAVDALGP